MLLIFLASSVPGDQVPGTISDKLAHLLVYAVLGACFMLPLSLINLLAAAAWHYMPPGLPRWIVSGLLVVGPYLLLGRGLFKNKNLTKRVYRYAE